MEKFEDSLNHIYIIRALMYGTETGTWTNRKTESNVI